jgi:hypothetical protein
MERTLTQAVSESIASAEDHLSQVAQNKWVDAAIATGLVVTAIASRGKISQAVEGLFPKAEGLLEKEVISNSAELPKFVDLRGIGEQLSGESLPGLAPGHFKSELGDSTAAAMANMLKAMPATGRGGIKELKLIYEPGKPVQIPSYNSNSR